MKPTLKKLSFFSGGLLAALSLGVLAQVSGGGVEGGGGRPAGTNFSTQFKNGANFGGTGPGTSGQVLTSRGAGLSPTFQAASGGSVSSVGLTAPSIFTVSGSPVTTTGTLALTAAGTSGGVPYFSGATSLASSAALASNAVVLGGGAGTAPATDTDLTWTASTNVLSLGSVATPATIRAPNGSASAGALLTVRAGDGVGTNQAGGNLVLQGSAPTGTGKAGDVKVNIATDGGFQGSRFVATGTLTQLYMSNNADFVFNNQPNGVTAPFNDDLSFILENFTNDTDARTELRVASGGSVLHALAAPSNNTAQYLSNGPSSGAYASVFYDGSTTLCLGSNQNANLCMDQSRNVVTALGTNAVGNTNGFFYLPKVAGLPTGVPANTTGIYANGVATRYDSTNNQFCAYNGGWQCAVTGTQTVPTGGTGITSGTSGGIPYFSGTTTMASSGALAATAVVLGGGAGAAPTTDADFTWTAASNTMTVGTAATPATITPLTNAGTGAAIALSGGPATGAANAGGALNLSGGVPADGAGGAIAITAAAGVGTNRAGGALTEAAGLSTGNISGGIATFAGGRGGPTGAGGAAIINGGAGGTTSGNAGGIQLNGGVPVDGDGGNVIAQAANGVGTNRFGGVFNANGGNATGNSSGGAVQMTGGSGGVTGTAGIAQIRGGAGGSTSGDGGDVYLQPGTPISGNGGSLNVIAADGVGSNKNGGNINLTVGAKTGSGVIGSIVLTNATQTGAQTATFIATNKPGSGTTAPSLWLRVVVGATTYYIPMWQ